jgi:hypothetical protein
MVKKKASVVAKPPAIPQGNFTWLRDLVALSLNETSFLPKAAEALAYDWLMTRSDLTEKFVKPAILHLIRQEMSRIIDNQGLRPLSKFTPGSSNSVPDLDETTDDAPLDSPLPSLSPVAQARQAAYWEATRHDQETLLDEELLDGTRIGDATRAQLLANANTSLAHAKTLMMRRAYYALIAQALPDDQKRVREHLDADELYRLREQATAQALR